jgi:Glycosyl hydrolases family 15
VLTQKAFNYGRDKHITKIKTTENHSSNQHPNCSQHVSFESEKLSLDLTGTIDCGDDHPDECPLIRFEEATSEHHLGSGIRTSFILKEGQGVSFVLRDAKPNSEEKSSSLNIPANLTPISTALLDHLQTVTQTFWLEWISQSTYKGRWREVVSRSLLILKLLTFEPTGAIVAAPTFSLPEDFGGGRNWDYRYCWVRDSSFTIYILLKMGFKKEADAYMEFMAKRIKTGRLPDGNLPIMFSKSTPIHAVSKYEQYRYPRQHRS